MMKYLKLKNKYTRITNVEGLNEISRFQGNIIPIDLEIFHNMNLAYYLIGIQFWSNSTMMIGYQLESLIDSNPLELFDISVLALPEGWCLHLDRENPSLRQIAPEPLLKDISWFEKYHDDDPEILAIVDEIISDIQAEEEAKNPKKDPFDDYWGL